MADFFTPEELARRAAFAFTGQGSSGPPTTRARLTHAFKVRVAPGYLVGACTSFQLSQNRNVDDEWEVNAINRGLPNHMTPQVLGGRTVSIERFDLYGEVMEQVWGTRELATIVEQRRPLELREVWLTPSGILTLGQRIYAYTGCYLLDEGRSLGADGDRVSRANVTLKWTDRVIVS